MRTLDQIIESLPAARRAKVAARGRKLIAEEKTLRQLRQARALTQENMATLLGMKQADISKLENRSDMLLSTLRSYVSAMGGTFRLIAEFEDGPVELTTLCETLDERPTPRRTRIKSVRGPKLVHVKE